MDPTASPGAGPDGPLDDPIARLVAEGPRRTRRRLPWVVVAAAGAVVVVAVVVAVLVTRDESTAGYDETTRANFMAACTAEGGDPVEPTCACIYDDLVATVPYERFAEVDDQLTQETAAAGELALPDDVAAIVDRCVAAATPTAS
jgi:hypothetical protein